MTSAKASFSVPLLTPILDFQTMDPGKFPHIANYHGKAVHQRDRGNLQIQWPNHTPSLLKIMADEAITFRAPIIKRERNHSIQCTCNAFSSRLGIDVFLRSMHEFGSHRRTSGQIFHSGLSEPINQPCVSAFQHFDPNTAVEQVAHHQVFAGGSGRSSGISNSTSAQDPIKSANSGIRRFISSNVGSSFSLSTSEITSRTRDSKIRAFSGASRSKLRSSSSAIVVTSNCCHDRTRNSTSHFPTR
jgi:hypothetical protein